jgi:hypothetical protein
VTTAGLRRGLDGKLYSARPLTREERSRAISLAHLLIHRDHLSVRAAQQVMADSYGLRRSVGIITRDLTDFECDYCADVST